MKLDKFISELEKIAKKVNNPKKIEVLMVDNFFVMNPIFDGKVVYITDKARNGAMKKHMGGLMGAI